jgi:hypothetical protein
LPEVVRAKLMSKLAYVEEEAVKQNLERAIALLPQYEASLACMVAEVEAEGEEAKTAGAKFQALQRLLQRLLFERGSDGREESPKLLVFVERVSVAGPMAQLLSASLGLDVAHARCPR